MGKYSSSSPHVRRAVPRILRETLHYVIAIAEKADGELAVFCSVFALRSKVNSLLDCITEMEPIATASKVRRRGVKF